MTKVTEDKHATIYYFVSQNIGKLYPEKTSMSMSVTLQYLLLEHPSSTED